MAAISYTKEQQEVIDLRDANLIVSAAAGSGKTAVLTARIISLLTDEKSPVDIDRMLIVTFTKAAAAEMRERIGRAIEVYCAEHPEDARMERQGTLLYNAQITTIDSFCLWVVRNHFSEISLDPGFRILDEGEKKLLFQDVMEELLEEEYAARQEDFVFLTESYFPDGKTNPVPVMLEALFEFAMSHPFPEKWLKEAVEEEAPGREIGERSWYSYLSARADIVIGKLKTLAEDALEKCRSATGPAAYEEQAQAFVSLTESLLGENSYEGRAMIFSNTEIPRLKSSKRQGEDPELREATKAVLEKCKKLLPEIREYYSQGAEELQQQQVLISRNLSTLVRLTIALSERFAAAKRERNALDFSDMEHFALQILLKEEDGEVKPTQAALEYREHFACICVDEYQDSNYVQEYILKSIAREDDYFCVGDIKQSIYRFRLACPEIFLKNYASSGDSGINRRIDLNRNFRSRGEVIRFINSIFTQLMHTDTAGMEYDEKARLYPGADYPEAEPGIYGAELLTLDATAGIPEGVILTGDDVAEEGAEDEPGEDDAAESGEKGKKLNREELECWLVADRIRRMVQEQMPVWDGERKGYRPVRYKDIAILARSTKSFEEPVKRIFAEYGIPVHVGAQSGYFQTREVRLMMNVLCVIDNPMQDIPLYDTLTRYLELYTEEEIAELRAEDKDATLYQLIAKEAEREGGTRAKAERFFAWLKEHRDRSRYMTVRELLELLLAREDHLNRISALPGGTQRRENLLYLLEKASDYEKTSYRGLFSFVRYVDRIREAGIEQGEVSILDENADVVRVMTIHKSKGLEFPVCFCVGLQKRFPNKSTSSDCVTDAEYGIALDAIDPEQRIKRSGLKKTLLSQRKKDEELAEAMRVLYVALTRAKEKLIITEVKKEEGEPDYPVPDAYSILHASSPLQWVRMALAADEEAEYKAKTLSIDELSENILKDAARASAGQEALFVSDLPVDRVLADALKEARERVYSHTELTGLYTKTCVSELKRAAYEDEDAWKAFTHEERERYIPTFTEHTEDGYAGAKRGSAYHRYLELLDFASIPETTEEELLESWLKDQTALLRKSGALSENYARLLRYPGFVSFLQSDTARRMQRADIAGHLYREQAFFIGVPASRLKEAFPASETILIQGVVDAYWEEDGELVLLDYKTDRVDKGEELLKRYRAQLMIYAEALSQATGKRVKELLIYSFALEKTLPVS